MKQYNRENIQRAAGILEGLRSFADEKQENALTNAIELLNLVLFEEPVESEDTK